MTSSVSSAFREWVSAGQTLGDLRGSPRKATLESAIPLPQRPCTPGTRCTKSATPTPGKKAATAYNLAALSICILGGCGAFFKLAAFTSTQTATPLNLDLMTAAVPDSQVSCSACRQ